MKGIAELGGRAEDRCATRHAHLWGAIATNSGAPHSSYAIPFIEITDVLDACDHGLWQITTSSLEYLRQSELGLNPLPDAAFTDPTLAAPALPSAGRTQMKLRIRCSDGASPRVLDMDMNQSVMVVARKICASWLVPPDTIEVRNQQDVAQGGASVTRAGFVVDSFVGLSFTRLEESLNNQDAIFTTHAFVAAGTQVNVAIPAYARQVTIYQAATIGNAAVMWTQRYGAPPATASIEIGALPFIAGARKTEPECINPDATFLRTDLDVLDRFFTLVWTIRP